MLGNPLLAEKELALASRSGLFSSSMQKSHTPSCPTITYEEALRRELEYRRRLESTHPHLLVALNEAPVLSREICTDSKPDVLKRKLTPGSNMPSPQPSFHFNAGRSQPANWYPPKKKVIVRQPASQAMQAVQIPRANSVPSFWCKICKVDCVTEFNFGAHIGGKKHKLKKQLILGNRNTGRPGTGSQFAGNTNRVPSENAVSGSRNDEPNVCSSSIAEPSSSVSSGSRPSEANPEAWN
ncbi:hypothetical protein D1007_02849 [Hordeum vulgare]|uniref:Predicted protein n=1 Tax=Hordeum vulgare subsp. vulgare TaxID=112509 RepID=F2DGC3_HORVV|nr:uncharacterized protein LOC123449638 [Hordeum vulgare subsp. vulgare]XP_044982860.1 uncharacterized protein LOC123449638 [Hordeum vulgare subsp. vulgare]KAE8819347.1 hypothetical protein D1007_02849 [Hordeum vulgare]BAJ94144.1 predicted protein [Hordeum vulgare subsp. vulgare]